MLSTPMCYVSALMYLNEGSAEVKITISKRLFKRNIFIVNILKNNRYKN